MEDTPVRFDRRLNRWVPVPGYIAKPDPASEMRDDSANPDTRDAEPFNAKDLDVKFFDVPPPNKQPVLGMPGVAARPDVSGAGGGNPGLSLSSRSNAPNYPILKNWTDDPTRPGLAFDTNRAADTLIGNCNGGSTGYCQRSVRIALRSAGFDVTPLGLGSAKQMIPVLARDSRFGAVATGLGGSFDAAAKDYKPQKGDIAIWKGGATGPHGHIQMCVGFRQDGSAVWMSDFQTSKTNWTGLRDPEGHGGEFVIFRQHTVEPVVAQAKPDATKPEISKPKDATVVATNSAPPPKPTAAPQPTAV